MRCAIVSDVHGNLDALNAVLEKAEAVDALYCPGDIVGYGAEPNECCNIIRERAAAATLGNHDAAAVGLLDMSWFNPYARAAAQWTASALSDENQEYLTNLPLIQPDPGFIVFHGSLVQSDKFAYIVNPHSAWALAFSAMEDSRLAFFGHTHIAEYYACRDGEKGVDQIRMTDGGTIDLKPNFKYIINCGSVGQPRDGNPKACFGIYDSEAGKVEIVRVKYNIKSAQKKIRAAGLPSILADRLSSGS